MALWVVVSRGAPSGEEPDFVDLGGRFIAAHRTDQGVEMLVEGDRGMIARLEKLPTVLSVAPARDGEFVDDTDGAVVVSGNGTAWRRPAPETGQPPPAGPLTDAGA